jgi:hypothetical protein
MMLQSQAPAWIDLDPTAPPDLLGGFLICLLTLAIFSFLYKDNPFYKLAEHLFIGVSTAWYTLEFYDSGVKKAVLEYLPEKVHAMHDPTAAATQMGGYTVSPGWALAWRLGAVALSLMLLARLVRRDAWISRWPLALIVGIYAALKMTGETQARLVQQIRETMVSLWPADATFVELAGRYVLVFGLICVLVHFLFTVKRTRTLAGFSRMGVIVLMLAFGARFGYSVLGRIALLIQRIAELNSYGQPAYSMGGSGWLGTMLTPPWLVGGLIVLVLAIAALSRRGEPRPPAA